MSPRLIVPFTIPLFLFFLGAFLDGVVARHYDLQRLERQRQHAQFRLEGLQAQSVAARLDQEEYRALVAEFEELVGLQQARGDASDQLASLVGAVEQHFLDGGGGPNSALSFVSVSPGSQARFSSFVAVEFDLNLTGRFYALPAFLNRLTEIGQERDCTVSVGVLSLSSGAQTASTGELNITLPLRAYFRE